MAKISENRCNTARTCSIATDCPSNGRRHWAKRRPNATRVAKAVIPSRVKRAAISTSVNWPRRAGRATVPPAKSGARSTWKCRYAPHGGGKQPHGQGPRADHQPVGRLGMDSSDEPQDGDGIAQHCRHRQPSSLRHEHPRRLAHEVGENRQGNHFANDRRKRMLDLGHDRHSDEIQGHQQRGDHQQGPARRFQPPAVVGIEPDTKNRRGNRYENIELRIGNLLDVLPQANDQGH